MKPPMDQRRYVDLRKSLTLSPSKYVLLIHLAQNTALVGACALLFWQFENSWMKLLAAPIVSILMFRSFSLMHEAVHGLVSKNRVINEGIGIVSAGFCLLSFESWKQAHLEHHRWSGNIDKDPVMALIKVFPRLPKPVRRTLSFAWKCWLPVLSLLQHTVFWSISIKHFMKTPKSFASLASIAFPIALWGSLFYILPTGVTAFVLLPAVALYLIGTEIINAPHHTGLAQFEGESQIPLWNQFLVARTCTYPLWLSRFLVLNFNYHAEHHMFPTVPWYQLPAIHEALKAELGDQHNIDPQFAWVFTNRVKNLDEVFVNTVATTNKNERAA